VQGRGSAGGQVHRDVCQLEVKEWVSWRSSSQRRGSAGGQVPHGSDHNTTTPARHGVALADSATEYINEQVLY